MIVLTTNFFFFFFSFFFSLLILIKVLGRTLIYLTCVLPPPPDRLLKVCYSDQLAQQRRTILELETMATCIKLYGLDGISVILLKQYKNSINREKRKWTPGTYYKSLRHSLVPPLLLLQLVNAVSKVIIAL